MKAVLEPFLPCNSKSQTEYTASFVITPSAPEETEGCRMVLKYLKGHDWAMTAVCVVLVASIVYLELEIPGYMLDIITELTQADAGDNLMTDMDSVYHKGIIMVPCALGSPVVPILVGMISAYIAVSLMNALPELKHQRVQFFSSTKINRFSTSSPITRSTNDIMQIHMA